MEQNKNTIPINEMLLQNIESAMDNVDFETSWYFDIQKGMDHYEEWLGRKKQREIDIDHMIAGTRVRCSDNTGHTDRLTVGTIYELHDERQNDLLIRIRDDEGNIRWFPKSYFELLKEK